VAPIVDLLSVTCAPLGTSTPHPLTMAPWQNRHPTGTVNQTTRRRIMARDGYRCYRCGAEAAEVDHIVPVSEGGTNDPTNLAAICIPCHRAKTRAEAARGRARRATRRPTPRHPGLIE
jgi:5-methylcytosine-specific restriction protein A